MCSESKFVRRSVWVLSLSPAARRCSGHPLHSILQQVARQPVRWEVRLKKELSDDARRSGGSERNPNKRLQRTGISVSLIDNLRVMQLSPGR